LAAATARVGLARADLFPRFAIRGSLGRLSEDASDLDSGRSQFWSLLPTIRWPILSGGRIRAKIRVQSARQEQAALQYEKAVLTALEDVENALVAHLRERRRQESLRKAVAAERRALDLATQRYTGGLESFLSVLDAQRAVFAAEDELAQSDKNSVLTLIAVYKAFGGGWSAEGAGPPSTGNGSRPVWSRRFRQRGTEVTSTAFGGHSPCKCSPPALRSVLIVPSAALRPDRRVAFPNVLAEER
jgi:outer membrane protein TolC